MNIFLSVWLILGITHCLSNPVTELPGYTQLSAEQISHLQHRGFGSTIKTFRPTVAYREEEDAAYDEVIDSEPESSQDREPTYANQNYPLPIKATLQPNYPIPLRSTIAKAYPTPAGKPERRPVQIQQQYDRRGGEIADVNNLEEEKEIEEPDRLSILLPQSRFNCNGKNTGYYADEELGCEVFHYCQENTRHSWVCPEGFSFHQVHLICMPPGGDNICEKSSDYHFVNDFLYKPVNLDEYQHKPNITLRYSDRYYPDSYRPRYSEDDEAPTNHHQHSVRVTGQPRLQLQQQQQQQQSTSSPRASPHGQVFRSPEEINISLQQRRPAQYDY